MSNETESVAQDPNLPDEGAQAAEAEKAKQQAGIQARIDELTAKSHEAERRNAALVEQNMALLTAQVSRSNETPAVDPYPDMDPSIKKMIAEATGAVKREFQGQISRLQAQHETTLVTRDARAEAVRLGADDKLAAEAEKWAAHFRANGVPMNAQDAAKYAIGNALFEGRFTPGGAAPTRGAPATLGGVRSANIAQVQHAALPSNFDDLDPDTQLAILAKRGAGDIPL